jgi:hypothetical protein
VTAQAFFAARLEARHLRRAALDEDLDLGLELRERSDLLGRDARLLRALEEAELLQAALERLAVQPRGRTDLDALVRVADRGGRSGNEARIPSRRFSASRFAISSAFFAWAQRAVSCSSVGAGAGVVFAAAVSVT